MSETDTFGTRARARRAALQLAAALFLAVPATIAEDAPAPKGRAKSVLVQGGGSAGSADQTPPPPPVVTVDPQPARGAVEATASAPSAGEPTLRVLSATEGEATVEIDGRTEVVRSGSTLGADWVKSVSPERLVLLRPTAGGNDALVIVSIDPEGQTRTRTFWSHDPSTPAAEEVDQP